MTCCACGRRFGGLTGFDAHQEWSYGLITTIYCQDPATMTRRDGSHMFKQDSRGRWVLLVGKKHPHA